MRLHNTLKCLLISTVMLSSISSIAGASESIATNSGQPSNQDGVSFGQVLPFGTGSWNFNIRSSAFTLSNGTITVYSNPGVNDEPSIDNFVAVELYKDEGLYANKVLSGTKSDSATFKNLTGTFYVKVFNYNYPWLSGTYTVIW
ncbi:hypothetical protein MNQ98_09340 [Paenibacillus sp. N3/727]|uniref:hypothetical protein n=1 Tax=Paenibacillus sp. N3/727 TaxID=2925845 RepID=UPI001F5399BC|nr:hypothetical protein [Paenibacillus sp. N3/727]UNK20191.1 hypothetical protein MNQ98_09340 [Paenibacillus sp. N3/727]